MRHPGEYIDCDLDAVAGAQLVTTETGEKLYLCGPCWRDRYPLARFAERDEHQSDHKGRTV